MSGLHADRLPLRRWRPRFRLMHLLLLVIPCCFLLAWVGTTMRANEQLQAARRATRDDFEAIQGRVMAWSYDDGKAMHVCLKGTDFDESALQQLRKALRSNPSITEVVLYGTKRTDAALAVLKHARRLENLQLRDADLTDEGLKQVSEMQSLNALALQGGAFTETGLARLVQLDGVDWIIVRNPNITADGGARLKNKLSAVRVSVNGR